MLSTFSSKALDGAGILGKKVAFVSGDTQTKSDAARASAKSMIEKKDGAIMISGGSSSGVAVAVQALCQEAGIIFMAGLTHANDTTAQGQEGQRLPSFLQLVHVGCSPGANTCQGNNGNERKAYHLTADYKLGAIQPSRRCVNRPKLSAGKP